MKAAALLRAAARYGHKQCQRKQADTFINKNSPGSLQTGTKHKTIANLTTIIKYDR
jgi:hypothetical protein